MYNKLVIILGFIVILLVASNSSLHAQLSATPATIETIHEKAVLNINLTNNFDVAIKSARAQAFLLNGNGKVVGQSSQWVIGGAKDRPALKPHEGTTYHFVMPKTGSFKTARIGFSKIILEDDKAGQLPRDIEISN